LTEGWLFHLPVSLSIPAEVNVMIDAITNSAFIIVIKFSHANMQYNKKMSNGIIVPFRKTLIILFGIRTDLPKGFD